MKKQLLYVATTLSLCLMMGAVAMAQMTRQMTVTVPFDFYVGKTAVSAGTYTVYRTSTSTGDGFLLRDSSGQVKAAFSGQQVQSGKARSAARLEFRRYNDSYFLGRVWSAGSNIGRELQQSRFERDKAQGESRHLAQKNVAPEFVTVTTQ